MSEDIDHQSSDSRLHIAWYGFQHVDQTISYQLAVGTRPGADDIDRFKVVGRLSKMVTHLVLEPFKVELRKILRKITTNIEPFFVQLNVLITTSANSSY